jgi:hypothetical protein
LSNGRALITLDRPGTEAFPAMVNDKTGETKLSLGFPPEVAQDTSAIEIGTKGTKSFLRFDGKSGKNVTIFSTEDGRNPSFMTLTPKGSTKSNASETRHDASSRSYSKPRFCGTLGAEPQYQSARPRRLDINASIHGTAADPVRSCAAKPRLRLSLEAFLASLHFLQDGKPSEQAFGYIAA